MPRILEFRRSLMLFQRSSSTETGIKVEDMLKRGRMIYVLIMIIAGGGPCPGRSQYGIMKTEAACIAERDRMQEAAAVGSGGPATLISSAVRNCGEQNERSGGEVFLYSSRVHI